MVLVNAISVIRTEYIITSREVCHVVNRLGIGCSVLDRPNS